MANIMLTDSCNLRCPYCFANEFVGTSGNEITKSAFSEAAEFILGDGSEDVVGIIGGEPTLHPDFDELMRKLILDKRVKGILLFTNGYFLNEHWDVCAHAKTHILINCNSPKDIGEAAYKQLCENLRVLITEKLCRESVTLGKNMYKPDFDHEYLIDLLVKYGFDRVRVSITVPNTDNERNTDAHDFFLQMKPSVFGFFRKLLKKGIVPNFDCNKLPSCLITEEEYREFKEILDTDTILAESVKKSNLSTKAVTCSPVIDIRQDLTAVRCFGLSGWTKQNIRDFKCITDLKNHYIRSIDAFAYNTSYSGKCDDCYDRKVLRCNGGCLAFKGKAIRDFMEMTELSFMSAGGRTV